MELARRGKENKEAAKNVEVNRTSFYFIVERLMKVRQFYLEFLLSVTCHKL